MTWDADEGRIQSGVEDESGASLWKFLSRCIDPRNRNVSCGTEGRGHDCENVF